jgi:hypothetical protein
MEEDSDTLIPNSIKELQDHYIRISANKHNIHWNIIATDKPEPYTQILQENMFN